MGVTTITMGNKLQTRNCINYKVNVESLI